MAYIEHTIELRLNVSGYKGEELDQVVPDFIDERNTTVGLTWYPSVDGPTSFTLVIAAVVAAEFGKEFVKLLSKDLYSWCKDKVIPLLQKKQYPVGYIIIKLSDAELQYRNEELFDTDGNLHLLRFFEELPVLLEKVNPSLGREWDVYFDQVGKVWVVEPAERLNE